MLEDQRTERANILNVNYKMTQSKKVGLELDLNTKEEKHLKYKYDEDDSS